MFNMTEQMKKIQKMNEEKRLENLKEKSEKLRKEYVRKIQEYDDLVKIYNDITSDFYKDPIVLSLHKQNREPHANAYPSFCLLFYSLSKYS